MAIRIAVALAMTASLALSIIWFEDVDEGSEYIGDVSDDIFSNMWFYTLSLSVLSAWAYAVLSTYKTAGWSLSAVFIVEIFNFCLNVSLVLLFFFLIDWLRGKIGDNDNALFGLIIRYVVPYLGMLIIFWTSDSLEAYTVGASIIFFIIHFVAHNMKAWLDPDVSISTEKGAEEVILSLAYTGVFAASTKFHRGATYPRTCLFSILSCIRSRCGCCCRICRDPAGLYTNPPGLSLTPITEL
jgi:hypothetical protein